MFHSIYSGTVEGLENRPWKYPSSGSGYGPATIKQTILLRHALTLYHYTALRQQAHLEGVTVSHPLYYDHPKEDDAYRFSNFELRDEENYCDQNRFKPTYYQSAECLQLRPKSVGYAWGPDFIVYPVTFWSNTSTGIALQDVWAPPGTHIHFQSGRSLKGPMVYPNESFAPDSIPAYVKEDAIIPMQRMGSDATVLGVVLADGGGSGGVSKVVGQLYEDDGSSLLHADGAFRLSNVTHDSDGKGTRVVGVSHVAGDGIYSGETLRREWVVEFRQAAASLRPPTAVEANGKTLQRSSAGRAPGWWIETGSNGADAGEGLARLVVAVGMVDAAAPLSVAVRGLSSGPITRTPLRTDDAVNCSVVVYGATAAGVTAAVAAAREGASCCLIGDRQNVGGMTSGGLGKTDVGISAAIGGQAGAFYEAMGTYYNLSLPIQTTALLNVRPGHCDPAVRPCRYYVITQATCG